LEYWWLVDGGWWFFDPDHKVHFNRFIALSRYRRQVFAKLQL